MSIQLYFNKFYECAIELIKKELAYVCFLSPEEIRKFRGTLKKPGKNSPYRNSTLEENLRLFINHSLKFSFSVN